MGYRDQVSLSNGQILRVKNVVKGKPNWIKVTP
jgi:hypothetical protein